MKQKAPPSPIYIPVPVFYLAFFFFSLLVEKEYPFGMRYLRDDAAKYTGYFLIAAGVALNMVAWIQFMRTHTTISPFKPANHLQTGGVYAFSRNPMYIGLFLVYIGATPILGNWWTIIVMPFLILIIDLYVVRREEKILRRRFGHPYKAYKKSVNRWM
jgi:protein-S-isoprenylcysteine O-methyltransferase Ste14